MSKAMVYEGVQDYLRDQQDWTINQCAVQHGGEPPALARGIYVAVNGVSVQTRSMEQFFLAEQFTVSINVWWESAITPADFSGLGKIKSNPHQPGATTLEDLERSVIRELHHSQDFRNSLNGKFSLPGSDGDIFLMPLIYDGSGEDERLNVNSNNQKSAQWLGRRLRFTGLDRNQVIGSIR